MPHRSHSLSGVVAPSDGYSGILPLFALCCEHCPALRTKVYVVRKHGFTYRTATVQIKVKLVKCFSRKLAAAFSTGSLRCRGCRAAIGANFDLLHSFRSESILFHAFRTDLLNLLSCHFIIPLLRIEVVCRNEDKISPRR